jgi:hypothetical protein
MRHLSAKDDITGGKRQAFFREREGMGKKQGAQCGTLHGFKFFPASPPLPPQGRALFFLPPEKAFRLTSPRSTSILIALTCYIVNNSK